jgi:hypothetical protein
MSSFSKNKDKKWNAEKIVAYLLYSRNNLIKTDNVKLYAVQEYVKMRFLVKGGQPVKGLSPDDEPTPTERPTGKRGRKQSDSEGQDDRGQGEVESLPAPSAPKKKKELKGRRWR